MYIFLVQPFLAATQRTNNTPAPAKLQGPHQERNDLRMLFVGAVCIFERLFGVNRDSGEKRDVDGKARCDHQESVLASDWISRVNWVKATG